MIFLTLTLAALVLLLSWDSDSDDATALDPIPVRSNPDDEAAQR